MRRTRAPRIDACRARSIAHGPAGLTEVLRADCLPSTAGRGLEGHLSTAARSLLLLGVLSIILGGGHSMGKNNHPRCHSVWGVATVCTGRM